LASREHQYVSEPTIQTIAWPFLQPKTIAWPLAENEAESSPLEDTGSTGGLDLTMIWNTREKTIDYDGLVC